MLDCFGYSKTKVKRSKKIADVAKMQKVWIDMENPTKKELKEIKEKYKLHPLSIEDCMAEDQRPKMEHFDNYTFIVFKALDYNKKEKVHAKHLGIFVGKNFIITVHPESFYEMDPIKNKLIEKSKYMTGTGVDYLLYAIIDDIVDDYLNALDEIEDELEGIENSAMNHPTKRVIKRIFLMKKANITIRKVLWPEREILSSLEKGTVPFVTKRDSAYFRDVHDHVAQTIDMNEAHRDVLSSILDIYMSSVSNSMNDVMKTLTIITALVMIPTLISGIYGMNFVSVPELYLGWGRWFALSLMFTSVLAMLYFFRRKKWI